jgi:hypothetical protein
MIGARGQTVSPYPDADRAAIAKVRPNMLEGSA